MIMTKWDVKHSRTAAPPLRQLPRQVGAQPGPPQLAEGVEFVEVVDGLALVVVVVLDDVVSEGSADAVGSPATTKPTSTTRMPICLARFIEQPHESICSPSAYTFRACSRKA
jgi:hypothetical protein